MSSSRTLIAHAQKWMKFIVTELKDVVFDEDAWEHLVLEQKTKVCSPRLNSYLMV